MKNDLVISTVGDKSLHRHWLGSKYDTFLVYYGDSDGYEGQTNHYLRRKGFKYHLIKDLLEENPWIFDYEYIWLPDDDIYATPTEVNSIFTMMREYDLWLAQPSIMGWYGVDITLHQKGSLIRFTNWVEIMCPCFKSEALKKCKKSFKENNTGWSIETIWNVILEHPRDKIAIIDDVIVMHTRPVLKGDTYKNKEQALQESLQEANEVYYKWNLDKEMEKDQKYGETTGGEIYCSVVYKQIMRPMESPIPKDQRFWPPSDFFDFVLNQITSKELTLSKDTTSNLDAKVSGSRLRNDKHGKVL